MKAGWSEVAFDEACSDVSSLSGKLPASRWRDRGSLPVIDQGIAAIAGYTDEFQLAFRGDRPVIVFGDHTCRVKFVDQPFVAGADGVKLLQPAPGLDARYLYWFLATRRIASAGYSRHFKFLKRLRVPIPPLTEQRRIAQLLDQADTLRRQRRRSIDVAAACVQALFAEMFSGSTDLAENIALAELVEPSRPITYGILKPGPDIPGGVPYVRVVDIENGEIIADGLRRTSTTIASEYKRSVLAPGDLVMSIRGHIGRLAAVPDKLAGANITQDSARLAIRDFDPRYVMEAIRAPSIQRWMSRRVKGVAVQGINLADVKRIPIPAATRRAQQEFAARAREADRVATVARAHLRHLDALFASLRHRAFIGEL